MNALSPANSRVAICVCTHSRPQGLAQLLSRLKEIDLGDLEPDQLELLVVDNNPNPETRQTCDAAAGTLPFAIHYIEEPEPGVTYARNRAVSVALQRGANLVAFIDDDDDPYPDWLARLLECQAATGADIVCGTWILDPEMPQWAKESGIFRSPDKSGSKKKGRYGLPYCASTCNALVKREILQKISSEGQVFDHAFGQSGGEDKDFFIRARKLGARLESAEKSVVRRVHQDERYTLRGMLRRGFKNGCSQVTMARHHGDASRKLQLLSRATLKFLISLVLLPFCIFSRRLFMHGVYRTAKSCGVLYTSLTRRSFNYYTHSQDPASPPR